MLNRFIFNRIGALVIGLILLGVGLFTLTAREVKCGDEVMLRGDICVTTTDGESVERDYDEQKAENTTVSYVLLGVGGLIVVGGIIANIRHYTRSKAPSAPEPAA